MKTASGNSVASSTRVSERRLRRRRNAMARRKLQDLHEEKVLQFWLAEVWDQSVEAVGDRSMGYSSALS